MLGPVNTSGSTDMIPDKKTVNARVVSLKTHIAYRVAVRPTAIPNPKSAITASGLQPVVFCSFVVCV